MSYDLYFKTKQANESPSLEALTNYFRTRKNYEVGEKQAFYSNKSTGVYFPFDLGEQEDIGPQAIPVTFNLNYFGPHIFGLEADTELSPFVQEFGLEVSDPQTHGMGEGEYSREGFLRGWNTGNELGYRAVLSQKENETVLSVPAAKLDALWGWNFAKDDLQNQLGEGVFVPRIAFLASGGMLKTAVAWIDGIPVAMPEVDTVLIPRRDLAPRKPLSQKQDIASATWNELQPLFSGFPVKVGFLPYRLLKYNEVPASIGAFIKNLRPMSSKPEIVPVDRVLDAELIEAAKTKNG
jgi:hypothetical protein